MSTACQKCKSRVEKYIKFTEMSFLENTAFCVTLFFLFCENCDIDKVFKRLPLLVSNYIRTFIFKKRKALKPSNSKILSLNEFRILPISLNL